MSIRECAHAKSYIPTTLIVIMDERTMSLTSFIHIPEVRQRFAKSFPKPSFKLDAKILAPPLTKHYSLIGTAFDYLMRFHLKYLNPKSIERTWVAESAVELLRSHPEYFIIRKAYTPSNIKRTLAKADNIIRRAKEASSTYQQTGSMTDELLESAIYLAQLDPIFRAGVIDPNIGIADKGDAEDLRNLISAVDAKVFKAERICVLNPTFGEGSHLVGGADCDLLIDDTLIDIKTTKALEIKRDYFNQLIGYYILFTIGGIDGSPSGAVVKNLGIYFSRYSVLHTIPVSRLTGNPNFPDFRNWFEGKAKEVFNVPVKE